MHAACPPQGISGMSKDLRAAAVQVAAHAYARYSNFHVGAALRSVSGKVYTGCNVENAAYPLALCAERGAISAAVAAEGAAFRLQAIAVVAFDAAGHAQAVTPCGACRQVMVEFGADAEVGFDSADGWRTLPAADLLPHRFILREAAPD
ncbi:MAG: cytidine deaminase [Xanthomonadales bacterium]|nr:cytidine deaminase [Xanthomonadales bacterium]